jgi:hypothetical protein
MKFDERAMENHLVGSGWLREEPFPRVWHRPGIASWTDTETAFRLDLRFPEQVRQLVCLGKKVDP